MIGRDVAHQTPAPTTLSAPIAADILAVDDNPANLLAVETALEGLGANIVCAESGEHALRCLLERDFALVLLDVHMPSMDGFQTARLIRRRERSRRTPIIFITARDRDEDDVMEAYDMGAVDFLYKPIVPHVLRAKASVLMDLQLRTAEVAQRAQMLREQEKRLHQRELSEQRQRWEEESLRRQMEDQCRVAEQMAEKAQQLEQLAEERRCAQEQLTKTNQQLADSDRRKDEFLAVLAHELRNPLAPIVTSVDLVQMSLEADDPNPQAVSRALSVVKRQVRHLTRLVDDLLDISRITSGKIGLNCETLNLSDVIQHALSMSKPLIDEREHNLSVNLSNTPLSVSADSVRLAQVVANLLNNAARYTEPRGNIELSTEHSGETATIRVRDDGQGLDPEILPRIFEPFVQARGNGAGLGLGLTLVARLVQLHGGAVRANSAGLGQGSEFVVELPLIDAPVATAVEPPSAPSELPRLRIVLVEDHEDIREMLQSLLEFDNHDVTPVPNGSEGVNVIVEARPDVAFVDIGLPDLEGYEVARRVLQACAEPRPYLVAMTGFGQDEDRKKAFAAGFDEHLTKPVEADRLMAVLAEACSARRAPHE